MKATHINTECYDTNRKLANRLLKALQDITECDNGTIRKPYELASVVLEDGRTLIETVYEDCYIQYNDGWYIVEVDEYVMYVDLTGFACSEMNVSNYEYISDFEEEENESEILTIKTKNVMKTKEVSAQVAMTNVESVKANSMDVMVIEATTTKGDKVANVEDVTSKETKVTNEKKISLAQAEKNVVSLIEKLIGENTAKIARLIFSSEIEAEFKAQISELENDKQFKNANILRVMQEKFLGVQSGSNFVEFKANVSELRAKAIAEYKERFEAEKLKDEKRKAIETQISALDAVRTVIGETAYTNGVNALREQLAAI